MHSYPSSFFGTQPGKNVISQMSRVFLDLVINGLAYILAVVGVNRFGKRVDSLGRDEQ